MIFKQRERKELHYQADSNEVLQVGNLEWLLQTADAREMMGRQIPQMLFNKEL